MSTVGNIKCQDIQKGARSDDEQQVYCIHCPIDVRGLFKKFCKCLDSIDISV